VSSADAASEVARKGLGDDVVDALVAVAGAELGAHAAVVTDWKRRRGFER
jgi:glutamine synthetase